MESAIPKKSVLLALCVCYGPKSFILPFRHKFTIDFKRSSLLLRSFIQRIQMKADFYDIRHKRYYGADLVSTVQEKSLENVFSSYDFTCWGLRTELGCRVEPSIRHSCCFWCLFLLDAANSRHESRNEFNSSCTSRLCSLNLRNSPLFRLDKLYWCYLLAVLTAVGAAMAPSGKVPAMPSAMPFIDNFRVIRLPLEMAQSMLWDRMFRIAAFVWCREIFDK